MGFREFTQSKVGRGLTIGLLGIAIVALAASIRSNLGESDAVEAANTGYFICTETGKSFQYTIKLGDTLPVMSPFSGRKTGVMGELCYWTPQGTIETTPTVVLLNESAGKPGPTFCPKCDRLVVKDNPPPVAEHVPVKRSEYRPRSSARR
jgi:hypothetical protein